MNPFFRVVLAVTLVAFCAGQADANKRSRGHSRNHVNNMHHSKPSHNVNVNHRNNVNINQNNVNVNVNASNRGYGVCCTTVATTP
jgi:FlaG/FlaF family flagellin (archaellin)